MYLNSEIAEKNYYCLVAGLPDLSFGEKKLPFSSSSFRKHLKQILPPKDFVIVESLFLPMDNQNLLNLLFNPKADFNDLGIYNRAFLEEQIVRQTELPEYMKSFLQWLEQQESKTYALHYEIKLHQFYFNYVIGLKNRFLTYWITFEYHLKELLSREISKQFSYDYSKQKVIDETLGEGDTYLNSILEFFEEDMPFKNETYRVYESASGFMESEKAIDRIRWSFLEEHTFFHYFTIEKILSFLIQLMINERWSAMDRKSGDERLANFIRNIEYDYDFY